MGDLKDFVIENGILIEYKGLGGDVIVPDGVTSIGEEAFYGCDGLLSVTLPEGVTTIEHGAFEDCKNLASVTLPEGLTSIEYRAFLHCTSLTSIILRQGLMRLGVSAFEGCESLQSVSIQARLTSLGDWAFSGCTSLKFVSFAEGLTSIGNYVFSHCTGLTTVKLTESLTTLGESVFRGCTSLTSVPMPENLVILGESAFKGCTNLTSVTLPKKVTTLGKEVFCGCERLHLTALSGSLQSIGKDAFRGCAAVELCVKEWTPEISSAIRDCGLVIFHAEDIAKVPTRYRAGAAIGFACEEVDDLSSPRAEGHMAYLKRNAGKLSESAVKYPELLRFLLRHKLMKAKDIDTVIEEANRQGDPEVIAALLSCLNDIGMKNVIRARERKEKNRDQVFDRKLRRAGRKPEDGVAGLTFVISGRLRKWTSHREVRQYLERCGAKLGSAVTCKTDCLVTDNTGTNSNKVRKARDLGIDIISGDRFNIMVGK